jgi:hypothetical protein
MAVYLSKETPPMSSEDLHAPRERLRPKTLAMHQAIVSLMEELEAADWYQQRADDCDDAALKAILLHNMREEIEHAAGMATPPERGLRSRTQGVSFHGQGHRQAGGRRRPLSPTTHI